MVFLFGPLVYHRLQAHPSPKACQSEDMCQQKKNKNSNQAQRSGDFMRQKWRIYGLSDNLVAFLSSIIGLRSKMTEFHRNSEKSKKLLFSLVALVLLAICKC